jgi:methylenetetrahydrofolate dehydrogenase (NADP+)/methenyltetrahydrofolate cyclohydrolase
MNKLFDGKKEALIIKDIIKKNISDRVLTLGILQIGDDYMSNIFIREKMKFAKEVGININYQKIQKSDSTTLDYYIDKFNSDNNINAYLIQLPLVGIKDKNYFLEKINKDKDIDCLTSINYAKVLLGNYTFAPGVYLAFRYIFKKLNVDKSSNILIVGGGFVGRSIANYLILEKYNVFIVDRYIEDISLYSKLSDVIIFSAGVSNVIKKQDIKDNSILINIGASANLDDTFEGGISEDTIDKAKFFVPIKGGIGPMTIAMLFKSLSEIDLK